MSRQQRQREANKLRRLHLIAAVGLLPLAVMAIVHYAVTMPIEKLVAGTDGDSPLIGRLDPNTAPWWELTVLPGIGETRAKMIVEHRARVRTQRGDTTAIVFRCANDLQVIKGIGPKTAARAAPHLTFPQS